MPIMKPHPDRWQFVAEVVKDCMTDLGLRQADLVRASGLSDPTIRSFMTGRFRAVPSQHTKRKLEDALLWPPLTVDRILAGEDPDQVIESGSPPSSLQPPADGQRYATMEMAEEGIAQLQELTARVLRLEAHVADLLAARRERPG